jgi:hypothetical protein
MGIYIQLTCITLCINSFMHVTIDKKTYFFFLNEKTIHINKKVY